MAKETRAGKYGRNLAVLLDWLFDKPFPVDWKYKKAFLTELQSYSTMPRRKGRPKNEGTVDELEGIETINPDNPRHAAKVIKQGFYLMYQKITSRNALYSILENL